MKERLQKTSTATKTSDMGNIHKEIIIDNRIFLKGFHVDTKEEDLENIFKTYGSIVETKIIRDTFSGQNRGFGFITFDSQQVAQDVLSSVKSVQLDNVEVTVGPAKIRRNPPIKPFRYNQYAGTTYDSHQTNNQYMTPFTSYTASPEGFFTFYPPQTPPYYPTTGPTSYQQQQQPQKIPYMHDQPVLMEPTAPPQSNGEYRAPLSAAVEQQNGEVAATAGKIIFKPDNSNHIVNSSAKIESSVVLAVSSNVATVTTSKISNEIKHQSNGYPVNSAPPDLASAPPPSMNHHQFLNNNGYAVSTLPPPAASLNAPHQYVNINQPLPLSVNNEQQMKIPNAVPSSSYTTTNLPYENGGGAAHNFPNNINGIDLALITNGIGNMMPASFQYIPMATFYPPNTAPMQAEQHANYFYQKQPESYAPTVNVAEPLPSHHYPTTMRSPANNHRPCVTKIGNKMPKEFSPCSSTPENVPAALKAQNFVFMSTGPGKVNRVVVH